MKIEIRDEAWVEIHAAFGYYEERRAGLGQQFLLVLDTVMDRVRRNPLAFPAIDTQIHKALLRRFPYAVIFEVEQHRVTVLAVFHGRREPRQWSDRASELMTSPGR